MVVFINWTANLILTVSFQYIARLLGDYTFIVFTVIVAAAAIFFMFKVFPKNNLARNYLLNFFFWFKLPETKGKSSEEILQSFYAKKSLNEGLEYVEFDTKAW